MNRHCPQCSNPKIITVWTDYEFYHGSQEVEARVPVRRCEPCDFDYLDAEGAQIKEDAVHHAMGL